MRALALLAAAALVSGPGSPAAAQSESRIKRQLIRASIADYPRTCPCPYSIDRAGRRCGGRSAYSRPGGYLPLCYPADITAAMVKAARAR